jgi:glutaminyl-peptide cyclotransferase
MRIAINTQKQYFITTTIIILTTLLQNCSTKPTSLQKSFDGNQAFIDLTEQVNFGPRIPDSKAHQETLNYISNELKKAGWDVNDQHLTISNKPIDNVIAEFGSKEAWILIGAHYDTRIYADHDPNNAYRLRPVPGANDGASGVSILLELARIIPNTPDLEKKISLVFFDAEDNGNINGWDWIMGSNAYVDSLTDYPEAAIILDMVGDKDLQIYQEHNSDKNLTAQIWDTAAKLGYSNTFIAKEKYNLIDDHIAFIRAGIPAVDIIDFNYPYWHTTDDTIDKVSPRSLQIVGDTLINWLRNK